MHHLLIALDIPKEHLVWLDQYRQRFHKFELRSTDLESIEKFVDYLETTSQFKISNAIPSDDLLQRSEDPLLINRLCSLGILMVEENKFIVNWHNEQAHFAISKFLSQSIKDKKLSIHQAIETAQNLDDILEGHLLLALKSAFSDGEIRKQIASHCQNEIEQLLSAPFWADYSQERPTPQPEFNWDNFRRMFERQIQPHRTSDPEGRFAFFLALLSHLHPDAIFHLLQLTSTPAHYMVLYNRFSIHDSRLFTEPLRSKLASFICWAIPDFITKEYGAWVHSAQRWRSVPSNDNSLPTPAQLLTSKAKLDSDAIKLARKYISSLPANPTPDLIHSSILTVDQMLTSMKLNWQIQSWDTDGLRSPLFEDLAKKSLIPAIAIPSLESAIKSYLGHDRISVDDRMALICELSNTTATSTILRSVCSNAVMGQISHFLENPFQQPPHYYFPEKDRFDKNLKFIGKTLFQNQNITDNFLNKIDSAAKLPKTSKSEAEHNRSEICGYFVRMAVLADIKMLAPSLDDKIKTVIKNCYDNYLKSGFGWGPSAGIGDLLAEQGIISKSDIPSAEKWTDDEIRSFSKERKMIYSRHLIQQGDYSSAKDLLEESEKESWEKGGNGGGQHSEGIYSWMLSIAFSNTTTVDEFKKAVNIFEKNRDCVGVDQGQAYTLAAMIAEKANLFERAISYIEKAIQQNPGNLEAWGNKIVILLKADRPLDAFRALDAIPMIYHSLDRISHLTLATQVKTLEQIPKEVVNLADNLLAKNPLDHDARYNKAVSFVYAGRFADAISVCQNILRDLPEDKMTISLLQKLQSDTNNRNLELLRNNIEIRLPVQLSGLKKMIGIQEVCAGNEMRVATKIALAQVTIPECPDGKTYRSCNDGGQRAYDSIKLAVEKAKRDDAKIIFFPEITIPHELIASVAKLSTTNEVWIAGGLRHYKVEGGSANRSVLITPAGNVFYGNCKISPSPDEANIVEDFIAGDQLTIFHGTPLGRIAVLICYDIYSPELRAQLINKADILFVPSANRDGERLAQLVATTSSDLSIPVIAPNATAFSASYFNACCFKTDIERHGIKTKQMTASYMHDDLFCVVIPDAQTSDEYLARRPFHGTEYNREIKPDA